MNAATTEADYSGPVAELAVRRLGAATSLATFTDARERFIARLREQPGVRIDREFAAIVDFQTFGAPEPAVFIGMTQYDDMASFASAGSAIGATADAAHFFATFSPVVFTALRPADETPFPELGDVCGRPGQVIEVAHRDISTYPDFELAAYRDARDAFLASLREQPGVVAEYQWQSLIDTNIVVGMTVYDSVEAFRSLAATTFLRSAVSQAFVGAYPPASGHLAFDARA